MMLFSIKKMIAAAIMSLALFLPAVHGQCSLQCANGGGCLTNPISEKQFCECPQGFHGELCDSLHPEIGNSCTICPDGNQTYNREKLIPYLNTTCRDFERLASMGGDPEHCFLARQTASWCECPGAEPTCSLCPDGTNPVKSDLTVSASDGLTCSDFVFFAAIVPAGPSCASFAFLAEFCGGCETTAPSNSPSTELSENPTSARDVEGATPTISPTTISISPSTELSENPTLATDVKGATPTISPTTNSVSPSTELSENPTLAPTATSSSSLHLDVVISSMFLIGAIVLLML